MADGLSTFDGKHRATHYQGRLFVSLPLGIACESYSNECGTPEDQGNAEARASAGTPALFLFFKSCDREPDDQGAAKS